MSLLSFDDRDGWIWLDGEFKPWREAKVHVLTHALHYASAVFEGERMYGGEIYRLTEHSERLHRSAELLDFTIPYSVAELDRACKETCARNGLEDAYHPPDRLARFRDDRGVGPEHHHPHRHRLLGVAQLLQPRGARARHPPDLRQVQTPLAGDRPNRASKAAGLYMICTISKHAAEKEGYSDALMLDWRGYVAESTGANVFLIRDGAIHTPTPDCFLNGITRRSVIRLAQARGLEVIERHIAADELSTFSEVFLTGTAAEVTPVAEIGPHVYKPGEISLSLMEDYAKMVRRETATA